MRVPIAAFTILVTTVAFGESYYETGNLLYEKLTSSNAFAKGYAAGYVAAIVDDRQLAQNMGELSEGGLRVCVPNEATVRQIIDVVKKYLENNPENRHYGAASSVVLALRQAFPC